MIRASVLALGCLLAAAGCVHRVALTDEILEQVGAARPLLRVYPSRRVVLIPPTAMSEPVILDRRAGGIILAEDTVNGAQRLFVTFDRACENTDCSVAFVRGVDGRFRLASARAKTSRSSDVELQAKQRWFRGMPGVSAHRCRARRCEVKRRRSASPGPWSLHVSGLVFHGDGLVCGSDGDRRLSAELTAHVRAVVEDEQIPWNTCEHWKGCEFPRRTGGCLTPTCETSVTLVHGDGESRTAAACAVEYSWGPVYLHGNEDLLEQIGALREYLDLVAAEAEPIAGDACHERAGADLM